MRRWPWGIAWLVSSPLAALAFVATIDDQNRPLRWNLQSPPSWQSTNLVNRKTQAIRYYLPAESYNAQNREADLNSIRAAFGQWQSVPGTILKFEEGGFVGSGVDINVGDKTNVVFWAKHSTLVNNGLDDISGTLGYAFFSFSDDNTMAESDIVLNGVEYSWTSGSDTGADRFNIEAVVVHEIGHLIGLEHTPAGGAVMLSRGESGQSSEGALSTDEVAGIRFLYPQASFGASLAQLQGKITLNGAGILGATIFAEDTHGNLIAGAVSRASGDYLLAALPAGSYRVWVSPLEPVGGFPLLSGLDISFEYESAVTGFLPTTPVEVNLASGASITRHFSVTGGEPAFRITRIRPPTQNNSIRVIQNSPMSMSPGQANFIIGVYSPNLPASGASLTVTGDGLTVGAPIFEPNATAGYDLISIPISVATTATPGMRTLLLRQGNQLAYLNGFLEILPLIPDQNFDGLDDRFQRQYFPLFTAPVAGPTADPDQDGMNNQAEYLAGTIPTNALSRFLLSRVERRSNGMVVSWQSVAGKIYQLHYRDGLPDPLWHLLGQPVTAQAATAQAIDPVTDRPTRLYRVEVLGP